MRRIELAVHGEQASADGAGIVVPPGSEPATALLNHAQAIAAREGVVLAHVVDDVGTDTWLHIAPDGSLSEASAPVVDAPRVMTAPPTTLNSWSTDPRSRTAGLSGPMASRAVPSLSRRALLGAGAGAVGVVALGAAWWAGGGDDAEKPQPVASSVAPRPQLVDGQYPPAGWSRTAAWAVTDVSDPHPLVAARDGLVAVPVRVPGTGRVAIRVVDAVSGRQRWQRELDADDVLTDGPYLLRRGSTSLVAIATQKYVVTWQARSGEQAVRWDAPHGDESVGFSVLGPWAHDKGSRYWGLTSTGMKPFDIVSPASCFGTFGDAMVTIDGAKITKVVSGARPAKPTTVPGPQGFSVGGVAALTDSLVVLSWGRGRSNVLRAYRLSDLKPVWTTQEQQNWSAMFGTTLVSPDQRWASVANRVVDLSNGALKVIAATWNPVAIGPTQAWGDDGSYVLTCDASGRVVAAKQNHPKNETVSVVGGLKDQALVMTSVASSHTLYAIGRAS